MIVAQCDVCKKTAPTHEAMQHSAPPQWVLLSIPFQSSQNVYTSRAEFLVCSPGCLSKLAAMASDSSGDQWVKVRL